MPRAESASSATDSGSQNRSDLLKRATAGVTGAKRTTPAGFRVANLVLPAIIVIATLNAVLVVGWRVIDPTNASWIWGDPLESYLGWSFFRAEPHWNMPPLWAYGIGYPIGVSVSYLDTAPLVAVSFRLIDSALPKTFQYLGLLFLIGSVLQAYFGYKLFRKLFGGDAWLAALGACFLILAPVLLFRAHAHFTLTQQWLILAALYYYFGDRIRAGPARYLLPFGVLLFLAGGIHPYFLLMVALIALAAVGRLLLERRTTVQWACVAAAGLAAVCLATLVIFGYLTPGAATSADRYGSYSMNLLAPIDPQQFDALLFTELPIGANQYEGYSYLGLGLIVLLVIGVACAVGRGGRGKAVLKPTILPLAILSVACLALAISPTVTLGSWRLFDVPLPQFVLDALSPFQGSARLFWPVYYLLIVAALVLVQRNTSRRWALSLIAGMLVVQAVDVSSLHSATRLQWTAETAQLQADDWRTLGEAHAHLVVVPAYQCNREATPDGIVGFDTFGRLAIDQHMTINSYFAARTTDKSKDYFCEQLPKQLLSSGLEEDTAYVFSPDFLAMLVGAGQTPTHHFCRDADGFVLCAKDSRRAGVDGALLQRVFPPTTIDQDLLFGPQASPGLILGWGWSDGEDWGRWTEATEASLSFRLAEAPTVPLAVAMKVRAFAPNSLPPRRVRVVIDGTQVADWMFDSDAMDVRTFAIPASAINPSGIVTVHFEMPDARRPSDFGVGSETRLIGLAAVGLRIILAQ